MVINKTIDDIRKLHAGQYIEYTPCGIVYDDATNTQVNALDVLVWDTEEESEDDDGRRAVARYLVRDE